jgi:hypothetical protein
VLAAPVGRHHDLYPVAKPGIVGGPEKFLQPPDLCVGQSDADHGLVLGGRTPTEDRINIINRIVNLGAAMSGALRSRWRRRTTQWQATCRKKTSRFFLISGG